MRTICFLEDARNDSLQFSQEIVGLALDQISKVVIAELAERRAKAAIINNLKIWLPALATGGAVHLLHSLLNTPTTRDKFDGYNFHLKPERRDFE